MYTCATMAYSIQLQTTLTDSCGVQKQEKSIQTSNKKHFMKNVKDPTSLSDTVCSVDNTAADVL